MRRLRFAVFLFFLFTLIDPVPGVLAQPSFWQAANEGIEGGPVSAIVRNTAGRVLVSTLGGLYRLDEGQDKWVPTEITDVPTHVISAPDGIFYVIVGSRLYRSQDAQEWTFSSFPEGPDFSIADVQAGRDGVLLAYLQIVLSSGLGLYRSVDAGQTWVKIHGSLPGPGGFSAFHLSSSGTFLVTPAKRLFYSRDAGETWNEGSLVSGEPFDFEIGGFASYGDSLLFAFQEYDETIYRSRDDGATWEPTSLTGRLSSVLATSKGTLLLTRQQGWLNDDHYTPGGVWRSTNNGQDWEQTAQYPYTVRALIEHNEVIYAAIFDAAHRTPAGIRRSFDDGQTWQIFHAGLHATVVTDIAAAPDGTVYVALSDRRLFKTHDGGSTWEELPFPKRNPHGYDPAERWPGVTTLSDLAVGTNGELFAFAGEVFYSLDQGDTWKTGSGRFYARDLVVSGDGSLLAATSPQSWYTPEGTFISSHLGGVYRSTDLGLSWQYLFPEPEAPYESPRLHVLEEGPNGALYAGGADFIYASHDRGHSWTRTDLEGSHHVNDIAVDLHGRAFVARSRRGATPSDVLRSDDGGRTWQPTTLQGDCVRFSICQSFGPIAVNARGDVYTDYGYRSVDGGQTWEQLTDGLDRTNLTSLSFDASGYLWAGTNGGGVFRSGYALSLLTDEKPPSQGPFIFGSIYPNPLVSNQETAHIPLTLTRGAQLTLEVYDLLGRRRATITKGIFSAGSHVLRWRPEGLSSGTYLVRLEAEGTTKVTTLVVVK